MSGDSSDDCAQVLSHCKRTDGDGMEMERLSLYERRQDKRDECDTRMEEMDEPLVPDAVTETSCHLGQLARTVTEVRVASEANTHLNAEKKRVDHKNTSWSFDIKYSKEPKFIPYEPYKAATKPILESNVNDTRRHDMTATGNRFISNAHHITCIESTSNNDSNHKIAIVTTTTTTTAPVITSVIATTTTTTTGITATTITTASNVIVNVSANDKVRCRWHESLSQLPSIGIETESCNSRLKKLAQTQCVTALVPQLLSNSIRTGDMITDTDNSHRAIHRDDNIDKTTLFEQLNKLKREKGELENQIAFLTRINGEIKKLLIAAVGEDMEMRVQVLTQDKFNLAKQLLNTAKSLSTHQEQIEWLASQCQVWKSKFLASSMLVDDLAKWKSALCANVSEYRNAVKHLLRDDDTIRENQFQTFVNLSTLREKFDLDVISPPEDNVSREVTSDLVELSLSNRNLSESLLRQLLHDHGRKKNWRLDRINYLTNAEKYATQILSDEIILPEKHTDHAYRAVMSGAALALSDASPHCSHCTGQVSTV